MTQPLWRELVAVLRRHGVADNVIAIEATSTSVLVERFVEVTPSGEERFEWVRLDGQDDGGEARRVERAEFFLDSLEWDCS